MKLQTCYIDKLYKKTKHYLPEGTLLEEIPDKWKNYYQIPSRCNWTPGYLDLRINQEVPNFWWCHYPHNGMKLLGDCYQTWIESKSKLGPKDKFLAMTGFDETDVKICKCIRILLLNKNISKREASNFLRNIGFSKTYKTRYNYSFENFEFAVIFSNLKKDRKEPGTGCVYYIPFELEDKEFLMELVLRRWSVQIFLHELAHILNTIFWSRFKKPTNSKHPIPHSPSFTFILENLIEEYNFNFCQNPL